MHIMIEKEKQFLIQFSLYKKSLIHPNARHFSKKNKIHEFFFIVYFYCDFA